MTTLCGFKQEQASGLCMLNICKPGIFFRGVCFWQSCFVVFVNNEAEVMHTVLQTKKKAHFCYQLGGFLARLLL